MKKMSKKLLTPIKIREVNFKNRLFMSPMCQYSVKAKDGVPEEWHLIHYGSRAVGGVGLVMVEASAVSADGRISANDLGLWNEKQMNAFIPINEFISRQGSVAGIQLAHAGRKSEISRLPLAPSNIPFSSDYLIPKEMTEEDIKQVIDQYIISTNYALKGGFKVIEIHMAHGYLLHEFLSPISNKRTDEYGGSLENRMRFPLKVAKAIREVWPQYNPLFVRISATDWSENRGWDLEQSITLSKELKKIGVDLIDCSSGGNIPDAKITSAPGYQVPFAKAIKKEAEIMTGAVGLITNAQQAESILQGDNSDVIFAGRKLLSDPYWALHAAKELGVKTNWPKQYERAAQT